MLRPRAPGHPAVVAPSFSPPRKSGSMKPPSQRAIAILTAVIALLALPSAASATSTVSLNGRALTITGSAGPDNISVNYKDYGGPAGLAVTDQTGVTPGAGCQQDGTNEVRCPTAMPANGNLI